MKLMLMFIMALFMVGCASKDAQYEKVKSVYTDTREVVKEVPKTQSASDTLSIIDWVATTYDDVRTWIRGEDSNQTLPPKP